MNDVIPVERLRPIVERYLAAGGSREIAGTNQRSFYKVLEEPGNVTFEFAERLLIAIGCEEEWHISLADLYEVPGEIEHFDVCSDCGHAVEWARRGDAGVREADGTVWCALCFARSHRGFPMGPWKRSELLELYERYLAGATIAELTRHLWKAKGYRNAAGGVSVVAQAWARNGWPTRRRGESKSLRRARVGPTLSPRRKLAEEEARSLHSLHWDGWVSINQIAKDNYERLGLTQSSLCSQLSYTWTLLGLPRHERIEMCVRVSTKHGLARRARPKGGGKFGNGSKAPGYKRWLANQRAGGETRQPLCTGLNLTGKPCKRRSLVGRDVCWNHATENFGKAAQFAGVARARSPLHDPNRIESLPPLQAELRAYYDWAGGWRELSEETGRPRNWLSRISSTVQQKNIDRTVARDLRTAITFLTLPEAAAA